MEKLLENMRAMRVGLRVRAALPICYAAERLEVDEGSDGVVLDVTHGGALVVVEWAGCPRPMPTSADALEVLP